MPDQNFKLATTAYTKFRPDMGLPVQASNGKPRYKLSYPLSYKTPLLYPAWALVKDKTLSVADFRREYWAGLDKLGVENITDMFSAIAQRSQVETLVLMCFEKRVGDCHRGDFAIWWERNTGQEVPELS